MARGQDQDGAGPSRRAALGLGAGAVGLVALSNHAEAATGGGGQVDVAIVGAGFAGLTAARRLKAVGRSVVVLEADERVGGRTKAGTIAGEVVDLGGQWVGPGQTHLLALAKELGVATYPQYADGNNIADFAGHRAAYQGEVPALDEAAMADFGEALGRFEALAAALPATRCWTAANAAELDALSMDGWIAANTRTAGARSILRLGVRALLCAEAHEISLLCVAAYARSAGSFSTLIATRGGAQDAVFEGGVWQLAAKMAAALGPAVVLNAPVKSIAQDGQGVTLTTPRGQWRARQAVVTAPPTLAARIDYDPPLPALRDGLTQHLPLGSVIKVHVAYTRPFWREQGLTGMVFSDRTEFGPWFDHSPQHGTTGGLVGFLAGAPARRWADRDADARRAQVLKDIAQFFGDPALEPTAYLEEVWTRHPLHRGGYVSAPGPGVLTAYGPALLDPVGRLHWAGTETADAWTGYIDGAIRSGERAAAEVGALL